MLTKPEKVLSELRKIGMPADPHLMATPHFSWQELMTNQTEYPTAEVLHNLLAIAAVLEVYRTKIFKMPITITSGWRSVNYNSQLGGASKSYHCKGMAIDFTVKNWTARTVYDIMDRVHLGGVERTNGNWCHIDNRGYVLRFDNHSTVLSSHFTLDDHTKLFRR